jgi:radical SAM protein with 4Fe4S-binding SPASM domain
MVAEIKTRTDEERVDITKLIPMKTPINILVDPASICNFKCNFCPQSNSNQWRNMGKFHGLMDFDLYKKIIDELSLFPDKIKNLHLTKDGEPMMNKNLPKMIAYAKQSGNVDQVTITTNASLLTKKEAHRLIDAGLDRMRISLMGMSTDDYKRIANTKIDFEDIVEKIRYFYSIKKNCHLYIKVPDNCIKKEQIKEFYDTFQDIADTMHLEHIVNVSSNFSLPVEYVIQREVGMFNQPFVKKEVCGFIFYSLSVNSDGRVSPCCVDWMQELTIGDTNKQTLKDIWESKKLKQLSLQHLEGKKNKIPVCAKCNAPSLCCVDHLDPFREEILSRFKKETSKFFIT